MKYKQLEYMYIYKTETNIHPNGLPIFFFFFLTILSPEVHDSIEINFELHGPS